MFNAQSTQLLILQVGTIVLRRERFVNHTNAVPRKTQLKFQKFSWFCQFCHSSRQRMTAVITKKQKNTIMILGGIAGIVGAVAGASGLCLREKYLVYDQDWDVEIAVGFTQGYFGLMSGFILFLLGTVGFGLVYSRMFYLVFIYWLLSLSCDTLCVLDTLMVLPYTTKNGKFAWADKPGPCLHNSTQLNTTSSFESTDLTMIHIEYCDDIKVIAILLLTITISILAALTVSCFTTFVTSVALCRAKAIANAEQATIQLTPFSTPEHFQPMSFNNTMYQTDGFKK